MGTIKEHAASIKAPPGLDDPVKVPIGVVHYEAPCEACHGAPAVRKSLLRRTSGPVLGRHFGQCLRGAINAGGGHGLIAHNAALVGHHVCPTQHLVLLVWGGRARRDSQSQDHSAEPGHWSLHVPVPNARAHVLTSSTTGYAYLKLSTKFRGFYASAVPPAMIQIKRTSCFCFLASSASRRILHGRWARAPGTVRFMFGIRAWF